jgi:superfamily II DNA/RNA helicase
VTAQTGSGKTAAFVLPILNRLIGPAKVRVSIKTLILLPTRELAQQTLKEVERFSQFTFIKSGLITGGEDFKVQAAMLRKVPDILIGTPGRMIEQLNAGNLDLKEVEVLVLDEADRMLDMGFAEDVQRLVDEVPEPSADHAVLRHHRRFGLRDMVAKVLNNPEHLQLNNVSELNATTRQQIITADHNQHKEQIVNWLLANETYQKAIVFTNTRAMADRIYGRLVAQDYKAFVLHGEKDQKDRKLAIDRLKQGGVKILVATDVAARGLDVDGLDLVINFDMPRSGDEYVHRIGRTGRAGNDGLAISLICHGDWNLMSSIERYLKQSFERRTIKEVKGTYSGPKKVKASGKAVGVKKKKTDAKGDKKKPPPRPRPSARAPTGRSRRFAGEQATAWPRSSAASRLSQRLISRHKWPIKPGQCPGFLCAGSVSSPTVRWCPRQSAAWRDLPPV